MTFPEVMQREIVIVSAGQLDLRMVVIEVGEYLAIFSQVKKCAKHRRAMLIDGKVFINGVEIVRIDPEKMMLQMPVILTGQIVKRVVGRIDRCSLIRAGFQVQTQRLFSVQGVRGANG